VESPVFLSVHSTVKRSRDEKAVLLLGDCETNWHPEPALCVEKAWVAVGVLVIVGMMNMTVGVDVSVSVGVRLGTNVGVIVMVGEGFTSAVWVWAAPAVATTIVSREPGGGGDGFERAGTARPGNSHASTTDNATNKRRSFFAECFSMVHHNILFDGKFKFYGTEFCPANF